MALPQPNQSLSSAAPRTVLLVDDEEMLVRMTSKLLSLMGFEVDAYTSSLEALQAFQKNPDRYQLVITDLTMPDLTGAELAEKIHGLNNRAPVILFTGFSDLVDQQALKTRGISVVIAKPVTFQELKTGIETVLSTGATG